MKGLSTLRNLIHAWKGNSYQWGTQPYSQDLPQPPFEGNLDPSPPSQLQRLQQKNVMAHVPSFLDEGQTNAVEQRMAQGRSLPLSAGWRWRWLYYSPKPVPQPVPHQ